MTEAANGPDASQTTAQSGSATGDNGSSASGETWVAGLSEDNRTLVEAKKWDSPDAMAKSYRDLESHASKALVQPGQDASPEDWDSFYSKLGRPAEADGYEFALPEGTPEDMPYDQTLGTNFKVWAHEAGLNPTQAALLHDKFVSHAGEGYNQSVEQTKQTVLGAHKELVKEWGQPGSEEYERNVELADRAITQLGGSELRNSLKAQGALTDAGEVANAPLAKALAKVGAQLYSEDGLYDGADGGGPNPFKDGPSFNLTEQGVIRRADPQRARALIQAAGKNPVEFGL